MERPEIPETPGAPARPQRRIIARGNFRPMNLQFENEAIAAEQARELQARHIARHFQNQQEMMAFFASIDVANTLLRLNQQQ